MLFLIRILVFTRRPADMARRECPALSGVDLQYLAPDGRVRRPLLSARSPICALDVRWRFSGDTVAGPAQFSVQHRPALARYPHKVLSTFVGHQGLQGD